jgi:hypothetical protein
MGQKKAMVFMIGRRRNREDLRVRTVLTGLSRRSHAPRNEARAPQMKTRR